PQRKGTLPASLHLLSDDRVVSDGTVAGVRVRIDRRVGPVGHQELELIPNRRLVGDEEQAALPLVPARPERVRQRPPERNASAEDALRQSALGAALFGRGVARVHLAAMGGKGAAQAVAVRRRQSESVGRLSGAGNQEYGGGRVGEVEVVDGDRVL